MAVRKKDVAKKGQSQVKPKAKAYGGKTAFVLSLPTEISAKEVVAQAKAKGMILSEAYVYKIRSSKKVSRPNKLAAAAAAVGAPSVAGAPVVTKQGQSASDFVRALPEGVSAKEAVKRAKDAGIKLTTGYYYTLRSSLGLAGGRGGMRAGSGPKGQLALGAGAALKLMSGNSHEQAVLEAVEVLGIERVRGVLEAVQRLQG